MRRAVTLISLGFIMSLAAGSALSQPIAAAGGFVRGPGTVTMRGGWDPSDGARNMGQLKSALDITAAQDAAWQDYAAAVDGVARQMRMVLAIVHESMRTATALGRRDLMSRMFEARRRAADTLHEAADELLAALEPAQRSLAATLLPGR